MAMRVLMIIVAFALAACGGGNGGSSAPRIPPPDESPGGFWMDVRPNGTGIVIFMSEAGEFWLLEQMGDLGFGAATVSNQHDLSVTFTLVPPPLGTLDDGSISADCTATGSLVERQTIDYESTCTTTMGTVFDEQFSLTYDAEYERDSSLATIAGNLDDSGDVMTIDASGALFEQSAATGCVFNGQVSTIDTNWNIYNAQFTTTNCLGAQVIANGVTWTGIAMLLTDPAEGEALVLITTGDVVGNLRGLPGAFPRIP